MTHAILAALLAKLADLARQVLERGYTGCDIPGKRSRVKRIAVEAMVRDGVPHDKAWTVVNRMHDESWAEARQGVLL